MTRLCFLPLLIASVFSAPCLAQSQDDAADKIAEANAANCSGIQPPDITEVSDLKLDAHIDAASLDPRDQYVDQLLTQGDAIYEQMADEIAAGNTESQSGNADLTGANTAYSAGDWPTAYNKACDALEAFEAAEMHMSSASALLPSAAQMYEDVILEVLLIKSMEDMPDDWDDWGMMMIMDWILFE